MEIKSHPGRAANRGATWLFRGNDKLRTFENPLHLTDRKCKELRSQLEWAARELGARVRIPYIQPAVFLSAPDLRCEFDEVQRTHVYGRDDLTGQTGLPGIWAGLLGNPPHGGASRMDASFSRQLPKLLDKIGIQGLRRHYKIGSYELEPRAFDAGPTWEDYLAENTALASDELRRVRIYLSDRDAPREQREWARRAARREYLALQGISHEGIVRAEQFSDEHEAGPAIIFRHGRNWQHLDHFMAEHGAQLPVETRVEMVRQLAEALDHAHRRHLYHRALAARSVYVEMDGHYPRLRICDWQVSARPGGTSSPHTAMTSARATMLGGQIEPSVAAYLAPEFGNPDSDATLLDVFGLGALAYLVLTGQPPASSATDLTTRLTSERALVPSAVADQLSPATDDVVKGATAAAPSDRFESVREFLDYLDLVDDELTRPDQDEIPDLLIAGRGAKTPDGWEIKQVLGKGSTARALLMTKDGHERVYKVALTDAARTRLEHEAAQLRPLRDSHIVRLITGPVTIGPRTVLILERAGDPTAGQYLRSQGRFPLGDLESLGNQLFQVAEFLESEGVWHRDIKPDNLAIRQPPKKGRRLVLFDFSLADTTVRATQAGTPPYLDPFLGSERRPEFDAAAERYAIAVTLHEMASGELPSWGDGVVEPRLLDSSEQLPQLVEDAFDPRLRSRLVEFFSTALHRDAARRHASLAEMARGWADVFRELDQETRPATTPDTIDAPAASAAEARDVSAARVDTRTPLVAAGLSSRALSAAEDQLHVSTVGELIRIPAARVQRLRGVGLGPRNELLQRAREWRQYLQVAERAAPTPAGKPGVNDPAMLSLDEVVAQLVPRPAENNGAEILVLRLALGLPDADGQPSPVASWAPISAIATQAGLPAGYVSDLLAKARTRWTKSLPSMTKLRVTIREILERHGRIMESRHLATALLAERGCALADDSARLAVAHACLRAAIVTEEHLENPRLGRRRAGDSKMLIASVAEDDPSVPTEEELFDYAAELGKAADQLVALPDAAPLPGGAAARQQLAEVARPDGMPVLADTDLMALAVGASSDAALTARLELYPRTLSPKRALQLSQVVSYLAHPGIKPGQLRERVLARFPDLPDLPDPSDLRDILKGMGHRVEVVTGADGEPRYEIPGGTLVAAWSSTRGPASLSRGPDTGADTEAWARLTAAAERGGFLTIKTRWADTVAVTAELAALDGINAVPVGRLFMSALREIVAARGKPRWETVLAADSVDAPATAQAGLRRLVDEAWEQLAAHVRGVPGVAFLHDATPLARYHGGRELLTRLASAARQANENPFGLWLLCPMQEPRRPALLDGHIVGALGDGEQVVLGPSAPRRTESFVIDKAALLADLKVQVRMLESDLRQRAEQELELASSLHEEWKRAYRVGRTAATYETWLDGEVTQAAVAWALGTVFLRFCEDNGLIDLPYLAGPGEQLAMATERQQEFFEHNPHQTDRDWITEGFAAMGQASPVAAGLFDREHNPMWRITPSHQAAKDLLAFWRTPGPNGTVVHDFYDEAWDTRFLGDLYQDLSEHAKKMYALLQTPEFVEEFILGLTLEPAINEFGLEPGPPRARPDLPGTLRVIDPACGSGHFLLGAFRLLNKAWADQHPAMDPWNRIRKVLYGLHGVDKNPFAVSIARFRLMLVVMQAGQVKRFVDAYDFPLNIAVGDSLQHGRGAPGRQGVFEGMPSGHTYHAEDVGDFIKSADILGVNSYHVVVGNPPYITVKDAAENKAYRDRYAACAGTYALSVPFAERFFNLALRAGGDRRTAGYVGQITANSFMKREFGRKLIEDFFAQNANLTHVIDTSGAYIPGHGTPTVILIGRNLMPGRSSVRAVLGIRGEPTQPDDPPKGHVWQAIVDQIEKPSSESDWVSVTDLSRDRLAGHPWSLSGGGAADLVLAIETASDRNLATVIDLPVGRSIRAGADEAFMRPQRWAASSTVANPPLKPLVLGDGVRDWREQTPDLILYPYMR